MLSPCSLPIKTILSDIFPYPNIASIYFRTNIKFFLLHTKYFSITTNTFYILP